MFKGKYNHITSHKTMLQDEYRTNSYFEAIKKAVEKNDVVIDYGSGSGVLSIMAARCGAKKVFAIERNPQTFEFLKSNIKKNNLEHIIFPFLGDAAQFLQIYQNEKIDLVVSECIGDHLFENKMIYEFLNLADFFNVKKKIPESMSLCLYPSLIQSKDNHINNMIGYLKQNNITIDIRNNILPEVNLDVAYFEDYNDSADMYFCINEKIDHSEKDVIFAIKTIKSLDTYEKDSGILQKTLPTIYGEGYLLFYFYVCLYDTVFFTNHPSRPNTNNHSYYQRIIPKPKCSSIKINLDYNFDKLNIEDTANANIKVIFSND